MELDVVAPAYCQVIQPSGDPLATALERQRERGFTLVHSSMTARDR